MLEAEVVVIRLADGRVVARTAEELARERERLGLGPATTSSSSSNRVSTSRPR